MIREYKTNINERKRLLVNNWYFNLLEPSTIVKDQLLHTLPYLKRRQIKEEFTDSTPQGMILSGDRPLVP